MSPEYRIFIRANLPGVKDLGDLVGQAYDIPGVTEVTVYSEQNLRLARDGYRSTEFHIEKGKLIRNLRAAAGLTQSELGKKVGVGKAMISLIEHGKTSSDETLRGIVMEFGIEEEDPRFVQIMTGAGVTRVRKGTRTQKPQP